MLLNGACFCYFDRYDVHFLRPPSGRGLSIRMALETSQGPESSGLETKTYITLQTKVYLCICVYIDRWLDGWMDG
jgi:hypothetical protein